MEGGYYQTMFFIWVFTFMLVFYEGLSTPAAPKRTEVKRDHCNKTVDIYEDVSSPEVTLDNIGKPMTCWYRFRSFRGTPRDWILRIRFKKFKVGTLINATHCHMGYMQMGEVEDIS
ncbi:uncharacterized protein LOC123295956 [Chrysoperla carnea]|uniref:uncharacterized protein LOC123295956 n=1 Tax=Chrysoperla carnea TaxID=189513 RepID=UPI001D0754DA|nr:uncharacterized protein LOC123295956 [Chrysoperla carnea]